MISASAQLVAIREWGAVPRAVGRYFERLTTINVQFDTPDPHLRPYLQVA